MPQAPAPSPLSQHAELTEESPSPSPLATALMAYSDAVVSLPTTRSDDASARVMGALVMRDRLARLLTSAQGAEAPVLGQLIELDQRLRESAVRLTSLVGRDVLAGWRTTVQPDASAWWWSLDVLASEAEKSQGPLKLLVGGLFLTVTLSLSADISRRFLSGGPDFISIFSTLSQALLALLTGGAFTQLGEAWLERLLDHRGTRLVRRPLWRLGFALAAFGAVLVLWLCLPRIAALYTEQGITLSQHRQFHRAVEKFQRAIALDPDSAEAHYRLAGAYEDVFDYEHAFTEYEIAKLQGQFPQLYNNLARLYILHRKDPDGALNLLNRAEPQLVNSADVNEQYAFYKNRGWASLNLKLLHQAQSDLEAALHTKPNATAAHCLMAQVLEAQGNHAPEALAHWRDCMALYAPDDPSEFIEAQWLSTAADREFASEEGVP